MQAYNEAVLIHSIEPSGDDCACADAGMAALGVHKGKLG
jgi:hypothetical protein